MAVFSTVLHFPEFQVQHVFYSYSPNKGMVIDWFCIKFHDITLTPDILVIDSKRLAFYDLRGLVNKFVTF